MDNHRRKKRGLPPVESIEVIVHFSDVAGWAMGWKNEEKSPVVKILEKDGWEFNGGYSLEPSRLYGTKCIGYFSRPLK